MAEEAPAAAPAKAAKEKVVKPKKSGPSVGELIVKAVAASEERSCVSDPASIPPSRVAKVALIQTKGTGASGSFKINKKAKTRSKTPTKKPTVAKKPKPASAKKPTAAKKFPYVQNVHLI